MPRSDRHIHRRVLIAGLFATLLVLLAYGGGIFDRLEGGLYDLRAQRFQHFMPPPTDKVVHLDIDDAALEAMGAWPWPRSLMAEMVDEMRLAKAKVIAFDVLYAEPQEKQWKPLDPAAVRPVMGVVTNQPFQLVDHDQRLAKSFGEAKTVLLPASLQFSPAHLQSPAIDRATMLLSNDLETPLSKLCSELATEGISARDITDVQAVFYATIRPNAAVMRIERELRKGINPSTRPIYREHLGITTLATQPTQTRPTTMPIDDRDVAIRLALQERLFPRSDPTIQSPESHLIEKAYEQVQANAAFLKLGTPAYADAPAYVAAEVILPLAELLQSADSTGFVNYPNFGDGTARRFALIMEYGGKRFLHISLQITCLMLEVKPSELQITPTSIVIPAGRLADGSSRREIVIPVRTVQEHRAAGQVTVPFMMNIPFFGPREWWAMYDPQHPELRKQHVSLARVYQNVRMSQKLRGTIADADRTSQIINEMLDSALPLPQGPRQFRFAPTTNPADELSTRIKAYRAVLDELESIIPAETSPDDPELRPRDRALVLRGHLLRTAVAELPQLDRDLSRERGELETILKDKAAIIGWTSEALIADAKPTSVHPVAPGVVIHGVVVNAILTGELWRALPAWLAVLVAVILGFVVTLSVARVSPVRALIATILLLLAYTLVNCIVLFDYGNLIMGLGTPLVAMIAAWAAATITRLIIEARERTRITRRFATYVDPDLVNYVLEVRDETVFSGQRRETTVVFTDLEGFTKLSNQLGEDIVPLLNDFMGRAVAVIKKHRGLVNKFLGDGILFFFNAPKPNATYVSDAVDAILDLQVMMAGFNEDLAKQKLAKLKLRAGVTTGRVIAGDAGTTDRADYTVIGDLVNLASRLESANKYFGTANLITEATVKGAGDGFLFRPIGVIRVVGMETGVMTYETLAWAKDATEQQKQIAELSAKVQEAFQAGKAAECLSAVAKLEAVEGPTKLSEAYREICQPCLAGDKPGAMPKEIVLSEK